VATETSAAQIEMPNMTRICTTELIERCIPILLAELSKTVHVIAHKDETVAHRHRRLPTIIAQQSHLINIRLQAGQLCVFSVRG
jgi:hypothetical protein